MSCIITGGTGLLGKSLKSVNGNDINFSYLSSREVNLCDRNQTFDYFDRLNPNKIIHLAGKVGGIKDNSLNPYSFIQINNQINSNVIDYCVSRCIPIIFASSSCVYPKVSNVYPMVEDMAENGSPEETNDGYAYSKRFAGNMLRCAKKQYGTEYSLLYFCNLYGEYDDFKNNQKSHLVTALIEKFHNAKKSNIDSVELMGSGNPMRQFMYSMDAAKILKIISDNNIYGEYNVCSTENLTVREIAKIVAECIGYSGSVTYNGELDGVYRKDISCDKLLGKIDKFEFCSLREGIQKVYDFYVRTNYLEV